MLRRFFSRHAAPKRRRPNKAASLEALKALNVPVGTVIDVGVQEGTPALSETMSDRPHLLVEPIREWNPAIKRHYARHSGGYEIVNMAAAHVVGEATIRMKSVLKSDTPSHAHLVPGAPSEPGDRRIRVVTLDHLVAARGDLPRPFLIKIDVDGAEAAVLGGAKATLEETSVVILEVGITNFHERLTKMRELGFRLFDIVDLCYYGGRFIQADAVFVGRDYAVQALTFYSNGFDPALWQELGSS